MPRIRLCDSDRERYGGPEWVEINMAEILDEETGLLELLENHWDMSPVEYLRDTARMTQKALRAMVWLARRKAGCTDIPATFKPKVMDWSGITYEPLPAELKAADAAPPANRAERRAAKKKAAGAKNLTGSETPSTGSGSGSSDT